MPSERLTKRPRFSLLTLILSMTIVVFGLTIWQLYNELVPLRAELAKHRDTLGILRIDEPEKTHAIRLRQEERYTNIPFIQQFRVFLPASQPYFINHVAFNVPANGMPTPAPELHKHNALPAGKSLITVVIERTTDRKTGKPKPTIQVALSIESESEEGHRAAHRDYIAMSEAQNDWIVNNKTGVMCYTKRMVGRKVEQFESDEPVVLLRMRAGEVKNLKESNGGRSWETAEVKEPCDGFMLWIEPQESKSGE